MGRPNRPVQGVRLRDEQRDLKPVGTGDPLKDGFTRHARRPRSPFADEWTDLERADRIEEYAREAPVPFDSY